ncbi:hypothetical protein ACFVZC_00705 [Streptomyces marokkonensis]|uniref:Aminoglycoside phosphotransferase domain-containing protein n=1 Tax=Streptomyces marokkonensis TaxID=324855 RepID=A0ABW6PYD0_9ACTN
MQHSLSGVLSVLGDEPVGKALVQWLDQSLLVLDEPDLVATGRSGGMLMSAFLRDQRAGRASGLRIIKLVPASGHADAEPRNHRAALSDRVPGNEEFVERHLVELDDRTVKLDDYWLMIQFPAGDGSEVTGTLAGLGTDGRTPVLVEEVVKGVLGGWNPDPATGRDRRNGNVTRMTAAQFVEDMLGESSDRLDRARTWLRERMGPDSESAWFSLGEDTGPLPNPVILGEGSPLSECQVKLAVRGRAHGDLHPGNILVPVSGKAAADDFWLVDLSWYRPDALLARDPVHLLLCLVADAYLPHMSGPAREALLTALTGEEAECPGALIPQGLADTVVRVRKAMINWGALHHITPGWRHQWFLALQACALMVVVRRWYTEEDRWWFFRLAAEACRAYVEQTGVKRPRGVFPSAGAPAAAATPVPGTDAVPAPLPVAFVPAPARADPGEAASRTADPQVLVAVPTETGLPVPAPAPVGAEPGAVEVLAEIWDLFEPVLRQLSSVPVGQVRRVTVEYVERRATDVRLTLGHPRLAMPQPASVSDEECRELVLDRLSEVSDRAGELLGVLAQPLRRMQELAHGTGHPGLRALVKALGDLLDEVRRASAVLSAPRPV